MQRLAIVTRCTWLLVTVVSLAGCGSTTNTPSAGAVGAGSAGMHAGSSGSSGRTNAVDAATQPTRVATMPDASSGSQRCVPGDQQSCACPGSASGIHVCSADGTWRACESCAVDAATLQTKDASPPSPHDAGAPRPSCLVNCMTQVLATGQMHPGAIAVDTNYVYWTNQGSVSGMDGSVCRVPRAGGAVETLADHQYQPMGIALDAAHVYWTVGGSGGTFDGGSVQADLAGGNVKQLSQGGRYWPGAVAVDALAVYWAGPGTIHHVTFSDMRDTFLTSAGMASSIVALEGLVFWADFGGGPNGAGVMLAASGGGPATNLVSSEMGPMALAVDAAHLFWTTSRPGAVMRATRQGDGITMLASDQPDAGGIAIDDAYVYWLNTSGGTIRRVPIGGGDTTTLAGAQAMPTGIAVDATSVYWTNDGDGTVVKLDK